MTTAILNATEIERYENPETRGATEDSPGVFRCLYMDRLCEKVREAKEKADFCIVFIHWGTELMPAAEYGQVEKAQALVDAGADLIVGAHPHVLQNIEYIDGVPVFYSLGNYFFSAGARDSGVLRITLNCGDASIKKLQFIPMEQYRGVSTLDGSEKERVLDQMRSVSPGVAIDEDGFFTED
jgi:poly-gamma-glutamate synthesis protein (capsule biosynthesis protein)